ncbi:MAG: hypothetical protein J5809_04600 [Selenomonadaceae bacterium]|nr:hypothetical protein [Selenomonadaceae bacterium]
MSADFIKMISEIHSQRYAVQINNIIANKVPCGLFYGFASPENVAENIDILKNNGFNISALCVIDDSDKEKLGGVAYLL